MRYRGTEPLKNTPTPARRRVDLAIMGVETGQKSLNPATPPELHSEQDMLAWKREYNIRQREADWKRRQEELLTQKQIAWHIDSCERENRLAAARESRRREELESRVFQRHLEIDRRYKDRCREDEIEKRAEAWEERENVRLVAMHREARATAQAREEESRALKAQLFQEFRTQSEARAAKKQHDEEVQRRREVNIQKKDTERQARAAAMAQQLKRDNTAASHTVVRKFADRTVPVDQNAA